MARRLSFNLQNQVLVPIFHSLDSSSFMTIYILLAESLFNEVSAYPAIINIIIALFTEAQSHVPIVKSNHFPFQSEAIQSAAKRFTSWISLIFITRSGVPTTIDFLVVVAARGRTCEDKNQE